MEVTLDFNQIHFLKEWVKEGKSNLWIAKKLGISIKEVILAVDALCPLNKRDGKRYPRLDAKGGNGSRSPHGSAGKYNAGCRCTPCKEFNTNRSKLLKAERLSRPQDTPHGTMSGYWNWNCRCEPCKLVGKETQKRRTYTDPITHTRKGEVWIGPEYVAVDERTLTAKALALELGRTIPAVNTRRSMLNREVVKI